MNRAENKHRWLKIFSPCAIALGAVLVMDLSAAASPKTFELAQVRSRAIAPTRINITPPPGTHIPLPQSNSNYYYHNRNRNRYHRHHHDDYYDYDYNRNRRSRPSIKKAQDW